MVVILDVVMWMMASRLPRSVVLWCAILRHHNLHEWGRHDCTTQHTITLMNHTNTFFIDNCTCVLTLVLLILLPTARDNVFTGVCHSVHNWPHAYSVSAHPCWLLSHFTCFSAVGMHPTGILTCYCLQWSGEGYVVTDVCLSTGGVSASVHAGIPHPLWEQTPPQEQTPPGADTPPEQTPPIADPPKSRHPEEQILPQEQTPQEQTPSQE